MAAISQFSSSSGLWRQPKAQSPKTKLWQAESQAEAQATMDKAILVPGGITNAPFESGETTNATDSKPFRVAIIGGGPGGLFTAWYLGAKTGLSCQITVYEATGRLGGKLETGQFFGVGPYEAGVAEIYDYSGLGPDPLHDLIVKELGLEIKHIQGRPCVLDGKIFLETDDLAKSFGERTRDEALAFRQHCADLLSREAYYFSVAEKDNAHPWAKISGEAVLESEFNDDVARRYIRAMAHSDVAAPPHKTNGLTFLKNVLMDVDGYMDIVSVMGGNEQIITRLADELDAEIRLNANVTAVEPLADGAYRLEMMVNGFAEIVIADYVVVALPLTALSTIHWRTEALELALDKHVAYFDRPGHYLRATFLFQRPFWRETISADWWMLDAFDGCCIYDESARYDYGGYGLLAFLVAGNAALALTNASDEQIEQMCLDALPSELAQAKELLLDRRIHRWVASVSAIPGGVPVRQRGINHRPDRVHAPGLVMVGDYLFDATVNGVMDSAEVASDIILTDVLKRRRALQHGAGIGVASPASALNEALEHVEELMSVEAVADILRVTWGLEPGAKLLNLGSGAGHMVAALRALGFDVTGVECDREAWLATPPDLASQTFHCDFARLPFGDDEFDAVIETGLYRSAPEEVEAVIAELRRVTKRGVVLGSVTTDLAIDPIERFNLLEGARVLCSRWDWSEKLYAAGFVHALFDRRLEPSSRRGRGSSLLAEAWDKAEAAGVGPGEWYEDSESLLYCVYERASMTRPPSLETALSAEVNANNQDLVAVG
jgi:protoporphyrinogen oxidase/ubiquinone/menaquinone biosynthesis C-methylase UbiE